MPLFEPISQAIVGKPDDRRSGVRRLLLTLAVGGVLLLGYLLTAALLALTAGIASDGSPGPLALLAAALPGWLALHQVPLLIAGAPLSVPPLLPTIAEVLLIALASALVARRCRLRRPDQAWPVIGAMGLAHGFVGAGFAMLLPLPFSVVPVEAFLGCGLTAAFAATVGVANRCGLIYLVWERIGADVWTGLRFGLLAAASLIALGSAVLLIAIVLSAGGMAESMARMGHAGDSIGATVLSLLYLPHAILACWSFAAGTGFSLGDLAIQPLRETRGQIPDLPLLAVLPADGPAVWWASALLLPLLAGLFLGLAVRRVPGTISRRFLVAGVAAAVAALAVLLLALLAGGQLGDRAVSFHPLGLAVATLCWLAIPAAGLIWLGGEDEFDFAEEDSEEFDDVDDRADDGDAVDGERAADGADGEDEFDDFEYTDLADLIAEIPVARGESDQPEDAELAGEFEADSAEQSADPDRR
ncbi:DUF6350 family protein [Saccharopolyspora griseoalba]|uniref:DUF6350 family protein n=1 Tax=Saccharopolyspora griseoalba TaxID=1431848 RepID=A0ABW2LJ31_9PSEU